MVAVALGEGVNDSGQGDVRPVGEFASAMKQKRLS